MKNLTLVLSIAVILGGGCAPRLHPSFDGTFLPNAVPGQPQKRIDLSEALEKKHPQKKGFFSGSIKAPAAVLTWIGQDTLLVTVLKIRKREPDAWLSSFMITTTTGEVRLLSDGEQEAVRRRIEGSAHAEEKGAWKEFAGFVLQAAIAVVSGGRATGSGSGGGSRFDGTIENNGHLLTMKAKYGKTIWAFSTLQWRYTVTNNQTGRVYEGAYLPSEEPLEAFEGWLRSWRISPDGRHYLIGKTASLIDPENAIASIGIVNDYPYAGLDVSPSWDRIALLKMEPDEGAGRLRCWIEVYPFYLSAMAGTQ